MKQKFFPSRTKAQTFAKENAGYKFKDQGANAPDGSRWSVVPQLGAQVKGARAGKKANKVKTDGAFKNKKEHAITLMSAMIAKQARRKEIIERACAEIGISSNCASTYYQNVKLGRWVAA
jgi:hypothetical protein